MAAVAAVAVAADKKVFHIKGQLYRLNKLADEKNHSLRQLHIAVTWQS